MKTNKTYAKILTPTTLEYAPCVFNDSNGIIVPRQNDDAFYLARDWRKVVSQYGQGPAEGYDRVFDHYELSGDIIAKTFKDVEIPHEADEELYQQLDDLLEEHLRDARVARGYTTREPDAYVTSLNPRWKQDAEDWVKFRDEVMEYGLSVMNRYKETGEAISPEDFEAGLPPADNIWTYID